MKSLLFILFFTLACNKGDSSGEKNSAGDLEPEETETSVGKDPVINEPTPTPIPGPLPDPEINEPPDPVPVTKTQEFMNLINDHRESLGLENLIHDDELGNIVLEHSQSMANGSTAFGHDGFSQRCSLARFALGGGNWCGENVAKGQKSVQAAFNSWMNSPSHKANIEQSRATHTGFGYAMSTSGTYFWTQIFIEKN